MKTHFEDLRKGRLGRQARASQCPVVRFSIWILCLVLVAGIGCRVAQLPVRTVQAVVPKSKNNQADPATLQTWVLRYGDDFTSRTTAGIDDYVRQVGTPEAWDQGLRRPLTR